MKRRWPFVAVLSFVAVEAMAADCSGWTGVQAPVRYPSSANRVVLVRDLEGDGAPDIIASGNHVDELGAVSLLPNRGDGLSFGSGNPVRVHLFRGLGNALGSKTTFETQLANGDWRTARTINGALEIVVSERSGHLGLLRYANGVVTVSTIAAGPGFDLSSTFADVTGDGYLDIVTANSDHTASVIVNRGPCPTSQRRAARH